MFPIFIASVRFSTTFEFLTFFWLKFRHIFCNEDNTMFWVPSELIGIIDES